jgi:hypothetical protein
MSKLPLNTVLAALDRKDYDFYDQLDQEHKKQISPFLLNRYMSIVKGDETISSYYLLSTNQKVNITYFELAKHPKLIWQLLCSVSPGMGTKFHQWVGHKKKEKNTTKGRLSVLENMHPNMKRDELHQLADMYTDKEIKELQKQHGDV